MMFRKLLMATVATLGLSGAALAADLPARYTAPPPVMAPIFTWTGFYLGVNSGYAWQSSSASCVDGTEYCANGIGPLYDNVALGAKPHGAIYGGQLGYNWQLNSGFVLGVEADLSGFFQMSDTSTHIESSDYFHTSRTKYDMLGTVRGRLGYAWGPALLYVTGGFAWANVKDDFTEYNTDSSVYGVANGSNNASGWTVGGGMEYMFAPRWSLKTEYMYTSLGSHTVDISNAYYGGDGSVGYLYGKYPHNLNVFRSGINYHF